MNDVIDFLMKRQNDKRKFSFQYVNKSGKFKIHYPKGIKNIDSKNRRVELLFPKGSYTYIIDKMSNLKIIDDNVSRDIIPDEQHIDNLLLEDYFSKLVKYLINKNNIQTDEGEGFNYSLSKIYEMLNDQNQKKMNKVLFKNYMRHNEAKRVNYENQLIILPFTSNPSQKIAIRNALDYNVSVIQGPPGTGKTQTILNIIGNYIFQNKTVCIVSKNNSAVDNVIEKFAELSKLNDFSIRMGNSKEYIPKLMKSYKQKIENNLSEINISDNTPDYSINTLYDEIQDLEKEYEILVEKRNILFEIIAQKRHIDRKIKLYADGENEIKVNRFFILPKILKAEIENLKYCKDKDGEINKNLLFKLYSKVRFSQSQIDTSLYTMYQWKLEQLYAEKIIAKLQEETRGIDALETKINEKYDDYKNKSITIMNQKISERFNKNINIAKKLLDNADDIEFFDIKNDLINFYPVILTSLDSICSNIGYHKFDLVIVDEASQADIITCLPALNISKQIVFVGDTKQLSHIVDSKTREYDLKLKKEYNISDEYCYCNTNALDSIISVFNPPVQLLKEHYRSDYNIINYCNKMYYNDELVIYSKSSNPDSMQIMSLDCERNSDSAPRKNGGKSYFNKIEEKAIVKYTNGYYENLTIITPFGLQEENIEQSLPQLKGNIGTIYKFQGRQNKRVFVSTVLTHEKEFCTDFDIINDELLNVAVSRAEEKFVLFTHKKFFIDIDHNLKYLINYIETYGKKLESNVNSIFAYLYKQIPYIKLEACYDSLWEKRVHQVLLDTLKTYDGFYVVMKTSLADVIIDEVYLKEHPEFKTFALNRNTHIDFLIYTDLTNQPLLAIEVDGKSHKEKIQIERDMKKDKILTDHNIPVWRIKSTDAIEVEDIELELEYYMNKLKENVIIFLDNHKWKQ